jgi:hypothetical protein
MRIYHTKVKSVVRSAKLHCDYKGRTSAYATCRYLTGQSTSNAPGFSSSPLDLWGHSITWTWTGGHLGLSESRSKGLIAISNTALTRDETSWTLGSAGDGLTWSTAFCRTITAEIYWLSRLSLRRYDGRGEQTGLTHARFGHSEFAVDLWTFPLSLRGMSLQSSTTPDGRAA